MKLFIHNWIMSGLQRMKCCTESQIGRRSLCKISSSLCPGPTILSGKRQYKYCKYRRWTYVVAITGHKRIQVQSLVDTVKITRKINACWCRTLEVGLSLACTIRSWLWRRYNLSVRTPELGWTWQWCLWHWRGRKIITNNIQPDTKND